MNNILVLNKLKMIRAKENKATAKKAWKSMPQNIKTHEKVPGEQSV